MDEKELAELRQGVEDANGNIMQVLTTLLPNKHTGKGGIVRNIEEIEKRIDKIELDIREFKKEIGVEMQDFRTWKNKINWTITFILALGTALITIGTLLIQIFKK